MNLSKSASLSGRMTELLGFAVAEGVAGGVDGVEQPARATTASNAGKRSALSLVCISCVSALAGTTKAADATFALSEGIDDIERNL